MNSPARKLSWTIPRPGETIAGKYRVEGPCGRGGLSIVLSAIHGGLEQRVAIKMLLPEWADDGGIVERFLREGRAATRIKSEHVVRVFDVGSLDSGAPYLVLEYLEGTNLDELLSTWGPLAVHTAIDWVLQAAEAIAEAHALGIVHRDLKPSNLFLTRRADGSACVKVIDFGLSKITDPRLHDGWNKLTGPTEVIGSPHYMAPEQLRASSEADARTDVWALGAVLHELLTGQPPFRGQTVPELCATVLTQPAPPLSTLRPEIPPPIEQAVLKCLEKDPSARFPDMADFARAIAAFGTSIARASEARIERIVDAAGRPSSLSLLPSLPELPPPEPDWPIDLRPSAPRFAAPASGKIVLGALLVLTGLGAGALMWMYSAVHGEEPRVVREGPPPRASSVAPLRQAGPPELATSAVAGGDPRMAPEPPAAPATPPALPPSTVAPPPLATVIPPPAVAPDPRAASAWQPPARSPPLALVPARPPPAPIAARPPARPPAPPRRPTQAAPTLEPSEPPAPSPAPTSTSEASPIQSANPYEDLPAAPATAPHPTAPSDDLFDDRK